MIVNFTLLLFFARFSSPFVFMATSNLWLFPA
jgi:hypothetical protein